MLCKECGLFECSMRTPLGGCLIGSAPLATKPIKEEDFALSLAELEEKKFWKSFRREAAKDILAAAFSSSMWDNLDTEKVVRASISAADELVKQLREEQK